MLEWEGVNSVVKFILSSWVIGNFRFSRSRCVLSKVYSQLLPGFRVGNEKIGHNIRAGGNCPRRTYVLEFVAINTKPSRRWSRQRDRSTRALTRRHR